MPATIDGPASPLFEAIPVRGTIAVKKLADAPVSEAMRRAVHHAPTGHCVCWGIPFRVTGPCLVVDRPVFRRLPETRAPWFVFLHTTDILPLDRNSDGFISPMRGIGRLGEDAGVYILVYADGSEARAQIRRRRQIGMFQRPWGENCLEAVAHCKPRPVRPPHEQLGPGWGHAQTRATNPDAGPWINWVWGWENPHPRKAITGLRIEPGNGPLLLWGISAGRVDSTPLRWESRKKAVFTLPAEVRFDPTLDAGGNLRQIRLDLGQVISATPRPLYPEADWPQSDNNALPDISSTEILIEYTAHPEAQFHFREDHSVPVAQLEKRGRTKALRVLPAASRRVVLRTIEKNSGEAVPVKLHVHGAAGEYLAPVDRHRQPNPAWYEDYSVDFTHLGRHHCTYIPGETVIDLPRGKVYVEVSKGFEIRPVRTILDIGPEDREITIELDNVLPWREKGWVSADTHVHFLTPPSALLEGSGEGVNVVNLLASQWGELMTNVGDFDGQTTFGSRDAGGDGEYLVRVGTENRQHILGHISLLGYEGRIIAPMTTGGPDESALGDPVEILLTEWAEQCRRQDGLVVLPHFPNPRTEGAAAIVKGMVDGVEMTSWGDLYSGINPYSLSDWYRYLNCGYFVAAVGGTDKMSAATAVGTVRTYARLPDDRSFTYETWKAAVRTGHTFVTYGPLLEFEVDGHVPGDRLRMSASGGTVNVCWEVASVTIPMTRVELVVNGEIRECLEIPPDAASGNWSVSVEKSSWLALLVRGRYPDKPEVIAAHSSPVMVELDNSPFASAADALTILEQIEGAMAYLDTLGTRPETAAYKRMRLVLTSAQRQLHNRMHQAGVYHRHTITEDHPEHHG